MTAEVLQESFELPERVRLLHQEVLATPPGLCAERALWVTRYFKDRANRSKPMAVQKAEALALVLEQKRVRIYPRELLVGCFTSRRVGGGLYPELHGVAVLEDLFRFERRKVNPLRIDPQDRRRLALEVFPFWVTRFLAMRAFPLPRALRFVADQLSPAFHLINESGGISHFVPDYEGLLARGTDGFRREIAEKLEKAPQGSNEAHFLEAARASCDGLDAFAEGYRREAEKQAQAETDPARRGELLEIARVCGRVPKQPAETFQEALQSLLFAQIALNLESLDNAVTPGRLDQLLWPYYQSDLAAGRIDSTRAFELLGCFAVKLCEVVPAFSARITRFHGGLFNGQVVVVGGTDRQGNDATNELTYLLLELMDRLRTRQPNYHARLHRGSPAPYRERISRVLAAGAVSPAVYNDEVIVPTLEKRGIFVEDARDYATVGCVEPVPAGRGFLSTDAALVNLPMCLELALNQGRRFGALRRVGAATRPLAGCGSIDEVFALFEQQVRFAVARLLGDLRAIERANAQWHPTPLTSVFLRGCIESARDASAGGALYNGSGIQGVGAVEVGDSLAAIEAVVFKERKASLEQVVEACRSGFAGAEGLRARLLAAPKYGNDLVEADCFTAKVMEQFAGCLASEQNTRGGRYAAGFYSVTAHQAFGEEVGALPSGRLARAPFSSGISPASGLDRQGPTAVLCSAGRLPLRLAANGVNLNLKLAPWLVGDGGGVKRLGDLISGGFALGCMQLQLNVLDPKVLIEARDRPGSHPGLLVRVSGYSAYFDDLSPQMKQEIIDRTLCGLEGGAA